jgi:anthranilate/para-aminobenzoate synthase component I
MKGTRPAHADPDELRDSPKDRAELNMIVDLMRNDLGRVCEFGSLRVTDPRTIERHGSGVLQATATIQGRLRESSDLSDVLTACFPPGSVTGAPKVRAMQIIDEIEARDRGAYCGSVLVLDDSGAFVSSVGIRTAHIANGVLSYSAGAGIVADSVPEDEWAETLTKAEILATALGVDLSSLK